MLRVNKNDGHETCLFPVSNLNNKGLLTLMKLENDFNPNHNLYLTLTKLCLYPNITTPKP